MTEEKPRTSIQFRQIVEEGDAFAASKQYYGSATAKQIKERHIRTRDQRGP